MIVTQKWTHSLSMMQQSVLLSAIRGCDGIAKKHKAKTVVKWYRRCILLSAFDAKTLTDAFAPGGGSFTGPVATIDHIKLNETRELWFTVPAGSNFETEYDAKCAVMQKIADDFIDSRDELPLHYVTHMMHAFQIVGYKHPDETIREYWFDLYVRLVHAFHLWPEGERDMDARLGDNFEGWDARSDRSTSCSD